MLGFGLAAFATILVARLQGPKPFYNDSGAYWQLGTSFVQDGHFSLLNFSSPDRGYALPLVYHLLQDLINDFRWTEPAVVKTFNAVVFALIGSLLAPKLAETIWPRHRWGLAPRLALTALLIGFWSGHLNFPLSDFPGVAAVMLALVAIARPDAPGWMLLAGIAAGLAIDIRAANVLLGPALVALLALNWVGQRQREHASSARRAICVGMLLLGFATVSLPQSLSAHRYHGTWSFIPGATLNLAHSYLTAGLATQLSNAYVVPETPVALASADDDGQRLLRGLKGEQVESTAQYLGLIAEHPLLMGGLLSRHVINGLDQRYSTVYVENLHASSLPWLRSLGFLLVGLALLRLAWPRARRRLGRTRWSYIVALLLCVLTSVPLVMETRYLLPVYLLSWMVVLTPGWPRPRRPREVDRRGWLTAALLLAGAVAYTTIVWHVTAGTTSHIPPLG